MKVSLEITLYPLTTDYLPIINGFLHRIHNSGLTVVTNGMSTQVFGEYDAVLDAFREALRPSFELEQVVSVSIKLINSDLPPDRWDASAWS